MAKKTGSKKHVDPNVIMGDALPPKEAQQAKVEQLIKSGEPLTYAVAPYYNKFSQFASTPDTLITNPQFFSPIQNAINWQIAARRREIYMWLYLPYSQVLMEDFTYKTIADFIEDVNTDDIIYDTLTDGVMYDNIKPTNILGATGELRTPSRGSKRSCVNKLSYSFSAIGYWRELAVSEEHKIFILDGIKYQDYKDTGYKTQLISRKEAGHIRANDYLLAPLPKVGSVNIGSDFAWLIGQFSSSNPIDKKEHHANDLSKYITDKFTKNVFDLDRESRLHLLGGYFDGEGNFDNDRLTANIASCDLADQLYWLLLSVEVNSHLNKNEDHYQLSISFSDVEKIRPYMRSSKVPADHVCKKKRDLRFFYEEDGVKYLAAPIESIKCFPYTGDGYDIEVLPEKAFVASGYVTSNCRYFFMNEPKVFAGVKWYSDFSICDFDLEWQHGAGGRKMVEFYKHQCHRLDLMNKLRQIALEYHMLGDVFIHTDMFCPSCGGTSVDPTTGERCNHPGGDIKRLIILNPDWIEVIKTPYSEEPNILMIPDEDIIKIVQTQKPLEIYNQLSDRVKQEILKKRPIKLSNRTVTHLRHMSVDYGAYGVSMIRPLFQTLAYKTKLMIANWLVAERLIIPVRVVKIGSDQRPAGPQDIAEAQSMLAMAANEPNLTIVTHHSFDMDFYGACHDDQTEILTLSGWKKFEDVTLDDTVATYNRETTKFEYQKVAEYHRYPFKSKMIHFSHKSVDIKVTPNHRMLIERNGKEIVVEAKDVKHNDKFLSTLSWDGNIEDEHLNGLLSHMNLDEFLEFAGYYISEGGLKRNKYNKNSDKKYINGCTISQSVSSEHYDRMKKLTYVAYPRTYLGTSGKKKNPVHAFCINSTGIAKYLASEFGNNSYTKKIPDWIKSLPDSYLKILLDSMMAGDGTVKRSNTGKVRYIYQTVSKKLSEDLNEILLKLGYFSTSHFEESKGNSIYRIYWSERRKKEKFTIRQRNIIKEDYDGEVFCVTVPNGFIITRRNGRITIQGNSGKILQVTQEMEHIDKELLDGMMINQALLNGEAQSYACHSEDTLTLTDNGFKHYDEIDESDKIACFNPETKHIEYHPYIQKHVYDFDGEMVHFKTEKIDILVTPNHRMYVDEKFVEAKDVVDGSEFITLSSDLEVSRSASKSSLSPYKGRVFCFTVPHSLFVTMRNGRITVQGNSAQVGVETLIRRLETFQKMIGDFVVSRIFEPIAQMKGFVDKKRSKELGYPVWLTPEIKWKDMRLRDKTQRLQMILQLHDKQVVSTQHLCREFDINYNQQIEETRYEMALAGPQGAQLGVAGGGGGGGLGGMLGGGPAAAGGPGAAPEMGGPGGDMGGGMPGGAPGGGGGGAPGGGMGGAAGLAPMKVIKKSKAKSLQDQQKPVQYGQVRFTDIEMKFRKMLDNVVNTLKISSPYFFQYQVENPHGGPPYKLDFAFPKLKLNVECLHPDTLVPTDKGSKKAKDVLEDDKLYGRDGKEVSIVKRFEHEYSGDMYEITPLGLPSFKVTANHPILARSTTMCWTKLLKSEFVCADKLYVGDLLVVPKNFNDIEVIDGYQEDDNFVYVPIEKLEVEHYEGTVYNFETSGEGESDHTYLVGNIVTHNCDGSFHKMPDQLNHDKRRDYDLAMRGWTVVRFDDESIEDKPDAVQNVTSSYLQKLSHKQNKKIASSLGECVYKTVYGEDIIDLYNDELPEEIYQYFAEED